ncbi:MAG: dynamin family protein [Roseomonas sp.]|nr:dynamin family protein [Roseomonas sp.]MCA3428687.1 dynamin family protein [Roseomonas sp.]MCA3434599.1 dynamin family protein [Roseomonas sp.]
MPDHSYWASSPPQYDEIETPARLPRTLSILRRPTAEICFGGHYNAGKSSLLNMLLGRDVLPTGSLPETGTAAFLSAGSADHARLAGQDKAVACEPAALAALCSIYDEHGERRPIDQMPDRIDISLAHAPIPAETVWIDAPGHNDDRAMSDRLMRLAVDADVLVWVFNGRQHLSEPEVQFLRDFISRRGTAALAFVVNVFLPMDDEAAWQSFMEREWPVLERRLAARCKDMGLKPEEAPLFPVSARAAAGRGGYGFGAGPLRAWLDTLSGPHCALVRHSRQERAERARTAFSQRLEPALTRAQNELKARIVRDTLHRVNLGRRDAFRNRLSPLVKKALADFKKDAEIAGKAVASKIGKEDVKFDDTYQNELNSALQRVNPGPALLQRVDEVLLELGLPPSDRQTRAKVTKLCSPQHQTITITQSPYPWGVAAAGLGGLLFGGIVVAVTGPAAVAAAKIKQVTDTQNGARAEILAAAERAAADMAQKQDNVTAKFLGWVLPPEPPRPESTAPARRRVKQLEGWADRLLPLLQQA